MPSINIENAQIKTASIEIKALTINGRQLTLSTFRQIPEEDLIDLDLMKLNGVPWGHINYFWKDNGYEHSHFHIIWQKGKELRRYVTYKHHENTVWFRHWINQVKSLSKWLNVYTDEEQRQGYNCGYNSNDYYSNNFIYLENQINLFTDYFHKENKEDHKKHYEKEVCKRKELLMNSKKEYHIQLKKYQDDKEYFDINSDKLEKLISTFKDLPQLFIAI